MNRLLLFLITISILSFTFCKVSNGGVEQKSSLDSTKLFKIDTFEIVPKTTFDLTSIIKVSDDTLDIVTCSEYIYSPFGVIKNKSELKSSLLKHFSIETKTERTESGTYEFQLLKLNTNKLILFLTKDPESAKASYIFKGEIYDDNINFINGVRVGISSDSFYEIFFVSFPQKLKDQYNVVIMESCVTGIKHVYNFKNKKLNSIKFESIDSAWKVDY
jgi:hypothetical protein